MTLSKKELVRYSRQIILKNISKMGQEQLSKSEITIVGLGALGSAIANNLVRAGIGTVRLVDRDVVELDNLHRQLLYSEEMLGEPKAMAAASILGQINPDVELIPIVKDVNFSTIDLIISDSDLILDGTDNLETRFLINDFSIKKKVPWIYGGVVGTQGMTMNILTPVDHSRPCFRCLVPELPGAGSLPTCDTFGILNTIPIIIGSIQSTEAVKYLLNSNDINKKLIFYDVWLNEFRQLEIPKNSSCKCCSQHDFEYLNIKKRTIVTSLCGRDSVQITPIKVSNAGETYLKEQKKKLSTVGTVKSTKYTLELNIQNYKFTLFSDGRVLIKGTNDDIVAKSLYAKYIGN
jgi:adenylyltransferase/sulfurtransferase